MTKLDPQLAFLVEGGAKDVAGADQPAMEAFGLQMAAPPEGKKKPVIAANVLVQYAGDPDELTSAGMVVHGVAGDVVTGAIPVDAVADVAELEGVERIEAARQLETELDTSLPEARVDVVHAGPPGRRGAGVIVGVVDTGCDFTHPCFRNSDGTSRILALWDQGLTPQPGESNPAGFGYGVEYTQAQINAALASANPASSVRHTAGAHGTHVTGIAAGNGSIAGGDPPQPAGTFVGVAPEADIIVVAHRSNGSEGLGTSANALDAVNYVFKKARAFDKPVVVNMSLGDNLGPHDGTSLLERGLDNLLGGPGRAFVKSAGNAGVANCHAEGTLTTGETEDVRFSQQGGDQIANQIDLWYSGGDVFRISIVDPAGTVRGPVNVGAVSTVSFPSGNTARIDHRNNDPVNGDKRVFITIGRGSASAIASGIWRLRIQAVSAGSGGRFDAWIQRGWQGNPVPTFLTPHVSSAMTISTPGTAHEVITAANYSSKGSSAGSLVASSSRGPTRDGRAAPTLAAPGSWITAARALFGSGNPYTQMLGTSMSAPHITGTIALMFQKNRTRTQAQIRACLQSSARTDSSTGPTPNTAWGAGKLDAAAAVDCVPRPFVRISVPTGGCPSVVGPRCLSIPLVTCRPSVVDVTCRRLSVPAVTCRRVSVPAVTCGRLSVPVVTCGGPSVIDGCPSTPRGCFDPGHLPGVPLDPRAVDPSGASPEFGGLGEDADTPTPQVAGAGGFAPYDEGLYYTPEEVEEAVAQAYSEAEPPEKGYFDYDESWFDPDN